MSEYTSVGKIVATFGVEGELILKHSLGKKSSLKNIKVLFIEELKGSYIPWFIVNGKAKTEDETYIKLEGITSKETGKRLTQKKVWLKTEDFRKLVDKSSPVALIGYKIFNDDEEIGVVEEVVEQPHQVLLKIYLNDNEALIPLHEETLNKIDHKAHEVHLSLPDGLLDIYR